MTSKERIHAVLEGKPVDRFPVTMLYSQLYYCDHFSELTGLDSREMHRWLLSSPEEYSSIYAEMFAKAPLETLQPHSWQCSREGRKSIAFEWTKDGFFRIDKQTGKRELIKARAAGEHAFDCTANETQKVFDKADIKRLIKPVKAEEILRSGVFDCAIEIVRRLGREHFIITGGNEWLWNGIDYLGQTNMLTKFIDDPSLIDELCKRLLEQEIERIRAACAVGGDAIFIGDAMSGSDMISVKHYERFSLPYLKEMVAEIHRHNHKAILIYFCGVMDRLEQIVSTKADGLAMETAMKNYTNDIEEAAETVGKRITLFGNIDPIGVLQNGGDEDLAREIKRQAEAGRKCRGFVMCTGSPITPATPLSRVRKFLEMGRAS